MSREDDLGDRMKMYERIEAGRTFLPMLPIIARIDGRAFHSFTKGFKRPYDERMSSAMIETTKHLVKETGACMGYTQSDEITLAWYTDDIKQQLWFNLRICKMVSQLAAQATLAFYREIVKVVPEYADKLPTFDARVWQVPNRTEGTNAFLWREQDATKNSISMAAAAYYSHKELEGKNSSVKQEMLFQKGINWNDYPIFFKRGTYVQRVKSTRKFSMDELRVLPEKHTARINTDLMVERTDIMVVELPIFTMITNREEVIFDGCKPKWSSSNYNNT